MGQTCKIIIILQMHSIQGSHPPVVNHGGNSGKRANGYHAACKVEYRPIGRAHSWRAFLVVYTHKMGGRTKDTWGSWRGIESLECLKKGDGQVGQIIDDGGSAWVSCLNWDDRGLGTVQTVVRKKASCCTTLVEGEHERWVRHSVGRRTWWPATFPL